MKDKEKNQFEGIMEVNTASIVCGLLGVRVEMCMVQFFQTWHKFTEQHSTSSYISMKEEYNKKFMLKVKSKHIENEELDQERKDIGQKVRSCIILFLMRHENLNQRSQRGQNLSINLKNIAYEEKLLKTV